MIYYIPMIIAVLVGLAIGSRFVGELGFDWPDPFEPVEERL